MPKNRKLAKTSLILASVLLVGGFVTLVLEKNNITNFYTKPKQEQTAETRPVNSVAYTPATTTENNEGSALKQQLIDNSNKPSQTNSSIAVSFSAVTQDTPGGPVVVKALINGATSGTCKLVMIKDGTEKTYTATVTNLGTYYGCDGFSVPVSDLSAGSWKALLTVTSSSSSGSAEQQIEVSV